MLVLLKTKNTIGSFVLGIVLLAISITLINDNLALIKDGKLSSGLVIKSISHNKSNFSQVEFFDQKNIRHLATGSYRQVGEKVNIIYSAENPKLAKEYNFITLYLVPFFFLSIASFVILRPIAIYHAKKSTGLL